MTSPAPAPAPAPTPTTTVADTSAFGGPNAAQAAAANQALLVSSSPARAATATNVTNLQSATSNLTAPAPGTPGSTTNGGPNAQQNTPTGTTINIASPGSTPTTSQNIPGTPGYNPTGGAPLNTNADGTQVDSNATAVAGIKDPALAQQYKSSLDALDTEKTQAQSNLDAAQATVANDPAANAAIESIKAKYEQMIQLMKDKNAQVIGQANTSVAAFGGLGPMSQNFLGNQAAKADQRVNDLVSQEQNLILKAQIAYQTKDQKGLNDAMTAYNKANSDKLKAINDLLTATNKQVSEMQAQQKIDAAATKQALASDVTTSTNIATSIAKNIADSGITDKTQLDSYIADIAQQYGISNPEILSSAVEKAKATADKASLAAKNTQSIIAKRNQPKAPSGSTKPKVDGSYSYTTADTGTYSNFLNQGGTANGATYNKRGADGFVDPGAYVYAFNDWISNGGTPAGFAKNFPVVGNVNPASYSKLPAAIQPKAATTASVPPLPTK